MSFFLISKRPQPSRTKESIIISTVWRIILFKPTKASINQFRRTKEDFISYFIANNNLYKEDKGFALEPWKKIVFDNFNSIKVEKEIISMGNYYFENFKSETIKVEFTFGYIIDNVGKLRINLHHSSLPFQI